MARNDLFSGSKIALICDETLLVYQRDDVDHIPFPALWDLPGGGREGNETPEECALRELEEEFGLCFDVDRLSWKHRYESDRPEGLATYFFVGTLKKEEITSICFGDEGQRWQMMDITSFLNAGDTVPHLVLRRSDYLAEREDDSRL